MTQSGPTGTHTPGRKRTALLLAAVAGLFLLPVALSASDSFVDVASDNVFSGDIDWMADNGITAGCNPPDNTEYCPDETVTRAQMAAFMKRLATSQVVDAGALEGHSADEFVLKSETGESSADQTVVASYVSPSFGGAEVAGETNIGEVTIDAPADGVLVVTGSAYLRNESGSIATLGLRPQVEGGEVIPAELGLAAGDTLDHAEDAHLAYTTVFEVAAGEYGVSQLAAIYADIGVPDPFEEFGYGASMLTVEWHPEGSVTVGD